MLPLSVARVPKYIVLSVVETGNRISVWRGSVVYHMDAYTLRPTCCVYCVHATSTIDDSLSLDHEMQCPNACTCTRLSLIPLLSSLLLCMRWKHWGAWLQCYYMRELLWLLCTSVHVHTCTNYVSSVKPIPPHYRYMYTTYCILCIQHIHRTYMNTRTRLVVLESHARTTHFKPSMCTVPESN